jgi:methionyl-tRNA formyltransferase
LPEFRGIGVTEWPLIENRINDVGLGVTLHFMDSGVDTGPIVIRKRININECDSISDLESKYLKEMVSLMISGVKMVRDEEICLLPQNNGEVDRGRQYFATHRRMKAIAEKRILSLSKRLR